MLLMLGMTNDDIASVW